MIELVQFPWSPFCIVQRRVLEYGQVPFKIINVPNTDRTLVWRLTRQRYYQVPVIRDRHTVLFETSEESQVIAKYLDNTFGLGLFPASWAGLQTILWHYIEGDIESLTFKLNDVYYQELVPKKEWLNFIRHKERKFGRGCLEQWRAHQADMVGTLGARLVVFEQMLATRPFLLDQQPRFVDFDLFGMLGNYLYSGHYELPSAHGQLRQWYLRMHKVKRPLSSREKLHT